MSTKIDEKIIQRLDQLITQGRKVLQTQSSRDGYLGDMHIINMGDDAVDAELSSQWGISCLNILGRVFGKESDHYVRFDSFYHHLDDYTPVRRALGILKGAKDDYEHGFLFETRVLIEAEIFDDFLEQAEHLHKHGYIGPAAVVAGSVLEDGLRKLCLRNGFSLAAQPKMDTMNADLAKAGVYTLLVQKKITALADIRNKAAHGRWSEFKDQDVQEMLEQVRSFLAAYL
jgi:hypothetical protein